MPLPSLLTLVRAATALPIAGQPRTLGGPPAPTLAGVQLAGALNAMDFGAAGDGRTDDAPALQLAIDTAQYSRKPLLLPAGLYLVNSSLHVRWNAGRQQTNCSGPASGSRATCPSALHLIGEGGWGWITTIQAGAPMDAVITVDWGPPSPSAPGASPGEAHLFANFGIMAGTPGPVHNEEVSIDAGLAQYGLRAQAICRSRVEGLSVSGAMQVGIEFDGWINYIVGNNVGHNSIGIAAGQGSEANAVVIRDNNLEVNMLAGIVIGNGNQILIEGNEIEGTGGPAIVSWGNINTISIVNN